VTWSAKGKKICFVSERRQQSAMYTISLQKPAAPGAPASDEIDWDDIHLRAEMAAPIPA
jgi:Tol biopolymer transport system component